AAARANRSLARVAERLELLQLLRRQLGCRAALAGVDERQQLGLQALAKAREEVGMLSGDVLPLAGIGRHLVELLALVGAQDVRPRSLFEQRRWQAVEVAAGGVRERRRVG